MFRRLLLLVVIGCFAATVRGQISFRDTIDTYNKQRIVTNIKGMNVLAGWGGANLVAGGVGYFTAKSDEWKYFHQMNAGFGLVNFGLAEYGMWRAIKQSRQPLDMRKAWHAYRRDKRTIMLGIGFDVATMATGALLMDKAKNNPANAAMLRGYGKALLLQGIFSITFDNLFLAAHNKNSGPWATILEEMRFTGNGISYTHTF